MRTLLTLSVLLLLVSCGVPRSRDAFFESPETRFLIGLTERLAKGELDSVAADMYDQSNVEKNRADLAHLADILEGSAPTSTEPASWEVHKLLNGLRVTRVAVQFGYKSGRWFLMSGEFVGEPEQLRIASYRLKEIEFPLSVVNALTLSGKGPLHYAFMILVPAAFALSLYALVRCLRAKPLRRKALWVLFIVLGLCTFTLDWSTGEMEFQPISVLLMSAAFTRDGFIGPWTFEFAVPLGALLFLLTQRRRAAAGETGRAQYPPPSGPG